MRLLIVYCHPVPDSFTAAIRDTVLEAADGSGHETRLIDLYAEGFDPVMGETERRNYHTSGLNAEPEPIRRHLEHLKWCEGLIYIFPIWWSGPPAMMKGWWDRVWIPNETFVMPTDTTGMEPGLANIRRLGLINTHGGPWWFWNLFLLGGGRRVITQGSRGSLNPRCRRFTLDLHNMDSVSETARLNFLQKVARRIKRLR
ncbi:MAG: NAD(P)H-dependent oxidoreductase [Pseudomonadota bacterium]